MEIVYSPQRSDNKIYYDIQEPLISVYVNDEFILTYDINNPTENPYIYQSETQVTLVRFYGEDEKNIYEN